MNNKKSFLTILVCALTFGMFGTSCSDMLEPNMDRYSDQFAKDSVYSAFGILMTIQDVAERGVILDAAKSDLVKTGVYTTDSIMDLYNFTDAEDRSSKLLCVSDYYHIVNSCNFYLAKVDTAFSKNGYKEMKREYAAIQAIRSWTYLQLVNMYGSVPFITTPISSTVEADKAMKSAVKINKSNVADLLAENGLSEAVQLQISLGLPNYGSVSNGSSSYSTKQMFFPAQLVMGDAYLMQNQYEKAAEMYYSYFYRSTTFSNPSNLTNNKSYGASSSAIRNQGGDITGYALLPSSWMNSFKNHAAGEKLVFSIGATSSVEGKVMNNIQHIYGFSTSSSGATVQLSASQDYQQLMPSDQYISLNMDQKFNKYTEDDDVIIRETLEGGDARLYGTAPVVEYFNGDKARIINKFAPCKSSVSSLNTNYVRPNSFSMIYEIAFYRNPLVWLRYAEAINRMGFPRMAFAILKDGLSRENLPTVAQVGDSYLTSWVNDPITGERVKDSIGILKPKAVDEFTIAYDTIYFEDTPDAELDTVTKVDYLIEPTALNGACYYVNLDEMKRAADYPQCMDFKTPSKFSSNTLTTNGTYYGIHGRGCGDVGGTRDTMFVFSKMVAKKIAESRARKQALSYAQQLEVEKTLYKGDTLLVDDQQEIIDAVEDLIIDEGALETAFEGFRFADLIRVANHKNQAGLVNGTEWFAWKLARRNYKVTDNVGEYDVNLFDKLKNENSWYYALPKE